MKIFFRKNERAIYFLVIGCITSLLTAVFFKDLKSGEFLYLHDEFLTLTKAESFNSFFTRNPVDFGSANTTSLVVTFFDRLYYSLVRQLNVSFEVIQKVLYFFKLLILISVPYIGFKKLSYLFLKEKPDLTTLVVSLWYSFNTFTLIFWNGNGFSLTLLIYYSLAPLATYYYHQSIFEKGDIATKLKTVVLFFLLSFALYFFLVFIIVLSLYTILFTFLKKIKLKEVFKNLFLLLVLYIPFVLIHFIVLYDMFINVSKTVNMTGSETYGNLQGGFLYQLLMWFSWGVYTYWEPRNIFTFSQYFRMIPSIAAPFVVYGLILYGMIKKRKNIYTSIFLFVFLVLLFFVKGAQKPFGDLYLFLITHSAVFRIFRTPDTKFSVGIVLVLAILLLIAAKRCNKRIFIPSLLAVIIIQGYPLFRGIAIAGQNTKTSSDRIIHITKEYQEVVDFFNQQAKGYGYIVPYPAVEFGHYMLDKNEKHLGQDLLPKLVHFPFSYISESSGMFVPTYQKFFNAVGTGDTRTLKEFPVRYFVVRYDVRLAERNASVEKNVAGGFPLVFSNRLFRVYENDHALPMVQSDNVTFTMVNPVKYRIFFKNIRKDQLLHFYQSYNKNWKLYPQSFMDNICNKVISHDAYRVEECDKKQSFAELNEISYAWKGSLFEDTHAIDKGYANSWNVSPEYIGKNLDQKYFKINADGSMDFELLLYFKTQSIFYNGTILAGLYFIFSVFLIAVHGVRVFFAKEHSV